MNGKRSRRRGNDTELMVCAWLRMHGYGHARTTRAMLGHGGTKQPGDVYMGPDVDVVLEVKGWAESRWPTWIKQAKQECHLGQTWIVVRRWPGVTNVGMWPAAIGVLGSPSEIRTSFAEAVARLGEVAA